MMDSVRERLSGYSRRRIAHTVVVLAFLVFFLGIMQGWMFVVMTVAGWFDVGVGPLESFLEGHEIHQFIFPLLFWPVLIGMLVQLRSPERHAASQLMALLPFAALLLAAALTDTWHVVPMLGMFAPLVVVATLLHPAGRELVTGFSVTQVSIVMLVLVVLAAIPLGAATATHVGLQTGAIEQGGHDHDHAAGGAEAEVHEEHVEFGHFMLMTGFAILVVGMGVLATLRPTGYRVPAWLTGLLLAAFGIGSLVAPETSSSAGTTWGAAALLWAIAFVGAAELSRDGRSSMAYGTPTDSATTER